MIDRFDIAIVGAGVVGCAIARHLTLAGASVLVLEKAQDVLDGASKGNSAILHTGFDAPANSLEQHCLARGYAEFLKIADELGLPILKTGALVLAWTEAELAQLPALVKKAHQNGVNDVAILRGVSPLPVKFQLLKHGKLIDEIENQYEYKYMLKDEPGNYRLVARIWLGNQWIPWVQTNPIYIY